MYFVGPQLDSQTSGTKFHLLNAEVTLTIVLSPPQGEIGLVHLEQFLGLFDIS